MHKSLVLDLITNYNLTVGLLDFMDGASAQIPIVMGSITDENPDTNYATDKGSEEGFAQLTTLVIYDARHHMDTGSATPNSENNIEKDSKTGLDKKKEVLLQEKNETTSNNKKGGTKGESDAGKQADEDKKVTVQVGNGKCGSETATKLEAPMAEFMKFARGIEKNEIDEFIDKKVGDIVDLENEINSVSNRINKNLEDLHKTSRA